MKMLIVESKAKAKSIQKYLGADWVVLATGGHVRELPQNSKAYWANRAGELPEPKPGWEWTDNGEKSVKAIEDAAAKHGITDFYLATDPDREGEAIAWHLEALLGHLGKTHRVTFQEVTKEAVEAALKSPRALDMALTKSALVRGFLDRMAGFRGSKMARGVVPGRPTMGRVQTPTLGFVVERELEREAHVPVPYFEVRTVAAGIELKARFHESSDEAAWRDEKGKANPMRTSDVALATAVHGAVVKAGSLLVTSAEPTRRERRAPEPFTTDSLIAATGGRWGWRPGKTNAIASQLYNAGHITYLRTDSTRVAPEFLALAKTLVTETWGAEQLGAEAKAASTGALVQDAHEAIRPTRLDTDLPKEFDADTHKLYGLIKARLLASVMAPSVREGVAVVATADGSDVPHMGRVRWLAFPGWEAAFFELDGVSADAAVVREVDVGDALTVDDPEDDAENPQLIADATKPRGRYTPHGLIAEMKRAGIGRPSTYASTQKRLEDRKLIELDGGSFAPSEGGRAVWLRVVPLYQGDESEADLFTVPQTARIETLLDAIASGEAEASKVWEMLRDEVRDGHAGAQAAKKVGPVSPKTLDRLRRLCEAGGREMPPEGLLETEARERIAALQAAGVEPAPTAAQLREIERLMERAGVEEEDIGSFGVVDSLDDLRTVSEASALIEALKAQADERRAPSKKQLGFIRSLVKKAELTEEEAAAMGGVAQLEELTGGREGTASALIDALVAKVKAAKAPAAKAGVKT